MKSIKTYLSLINLDNLNKAKDFVKAHISLINSGNLTSTQFLTQAKVFMKSNRILIFSALFLVVSVAVFFSMDSESDKNFVYNPRVNDYSSASKSEKADIMARFSKSVLKFDGSLRPVGVGRVKSNSKGSVQLTPVTLVEAYLDTILETKGVATTNKCFKEIETYFDVQNMESYRDLLLCMKHELSK